jgi:thiol-disulfide isomerase/thioredoxin
MKHILTIFFIALLTGCFDSNAKKTGREGNQLPDFDILLSDSTVLHSRDILTKKPLEPIAFYYFNPICPYCRAQTKEIIDDIDKLKNIQFYFITNTPLTNLRKYLNDYKLYKYPNIIAAIDKSNFLRDYFEVTGVPYIAIYNKNKKLNKSFIGKIYSSQIKDVAEE